MKWRLKLPTIVSVVFLILSLGVGSGVLEIAVRYDKDAYRAVVALQLGNKLYVLHAFQKKSKRGIETPKRDVELIKQRYKEAKDLASYEEKENQI
jgi:phage-related protein